MNGYFGAGATFGLATCGALECGTFTYGGAQAVGGVGLQLRNVPIEVVVETRAGFLAGASPYASSFGLHLSGGAAARYFFGAP